MECTHPSPRRRRARERESATIEGMAETTSNASSTESSSNASSSNASNDEEDSDDDANVMSNVLDAVGRARLALRGTRERARGRGGWTTTTRDVRRAVRERREEAMRACVRGIREGTRDGPTRRAEAREERDVLRACARGAREARTIGAMALMRMVESGEPTRSLDAMREEREERRRRRGGARARVEKTAREIEARTPRVVEDVERACGSERCVREAFEGAREEARRAFEGEREARESGAARARARRRGGDDR